MHPLHAGAFLKFNVQVSQLLNNDFLVAVDVDTRNNGLAVEFLTVEVVPSVVVVAVNVNGADSLGTILGNGEYNSTIKVS